MNVWLTADPHFSHRRIPELAGRPYGDVDTMNDDLVARHNELVAHDDLVWLLGDVALGSGGVDQVGRLNGRIRLVPGNHDPMWQGHRKQGRHRRYLDAGIDEIVDGATIVVAGQTVTLSHFPYAGDSQDDDRHAAHRPVDRGGWVVHGHVHQRWRQRGRQINVGVDAWAFRPAHIDEVAALVAAGPADLPPLAHPTM
jgi:calcineurin-like phosphoesterase family protein